MAYVRLNTSEISDWDSFHKISQETFGFPDFYGKNMDAWIDCLTYLREGDGMSRFHLNQDEMLEIEVTDTKRFKQRVPEIFDVCVECIAFVNFRNSSPVLCIVFTDHSWS
jgi:hypothetical protein